MIELIVSFLDCWERFLILCFKLFFANYGIFWLLVINLACLLVSEIGIVKKSKIIPKIENFITYFAGCLFLGALILSVVGFMFYFTVQRAKVAQEDLKIERVEWIMFKFLLIHIWVGFLTGTSARYIALLTGISNNTVMLTYVVLNTFAILFLHKKITRKEK